MLVPSFGVANSFFENRRQIKFTARGRQMRRRAATVFPPRR
jgi:hypothetical protein